MSGMISTQIYKDDFTGTILEAILDYNPETGIFINKVNRSRTSTGIGNPVSGGRGSHGYVEISLSNKTKVLAHHLAWLWMTGKWPSNEIDHKNRIRDDNRFENLREATRSQNSMNGTRRKTNKSGKVGVFFHERDQKWCANLMLNYKTVFSGSFDTFEEAVTARRAAEIKYFGEFASEQ